MAKRRGHGEGSIVERGDGRWMARLMLLNGARKAFYGRTQAEVIDKLNKAKEDRKEGKPITPERLTVGQYLQGWLRDTVAGKVRPRTLHRYDEIVRYHLVPRLGHIKLARLTPADVERARREALETGQSPQSVAHHRAVLRNALNTALKHGLVGRNVAALADPPHVPEREYDALTPAKAQGVLQAIEGDRLGALYQLLLATGLREGEALGLRWCDVDLQGETLNVRRTLQRVDGQWSFLEPKTKRSRRTVPLPSPVAQALREHRARQTGERLLTGPAWQGEQWGGLVFTTETGAPLSQATVAHHFSALLAKAGLPRMRVHDLRHGAASLMAAMGVPARVAMELLGHSQIATTMLYTHVAPEYGREAMERVSRGLWARS